jgi:transposase
MAAKTSASVGPSKARSPVAASWRRSIEVFEEGRQLPKTVALFPEDRMVEVKEEEIVRIRLKDLQLRRPRQWGACWLACQLYEQLGLERFWAERLSPSRKGTRWVQVSQTLVCYRLIDPGSEWRLHRHWFEQSAMADLLGADFSLADPHKLYECHDLLLKHKSQFFSHLNQRWKDLFNASYEVLLYDLTSSYFESDPPFGPEDKRKFGHSRDKRSDCVQVVIGLVVTPEGFPLAYEVMAGNTSDKTTLEKFLDKIKKQYGKARRIWVMDRGVPTEKVLEKMRKQKPAVRYLVGTPRGRLSQYEKQLTQLEWEQVREGVEVKLLKQDKELYVLARSVPRVQKERAMRRRQLKKLWKRLHQLQAMKLNRDQLLIKLGAARQQSPSAWGLVIIQVAGKSARFEFSLYKMNLREGRRREGHYLLRTNLLHKNPQDMWKIYIQLTEVEEAFKILKGDLAIRPFHLQKEARIEAHMLIAFMAYCLHVTLKRRLRDLAPGLTPRSVLEKFSSIQMIDVHLPTTDKRTVLLSRYTQPEADMQMLLDQLKLTLPKQPPPKITAPSVPPKS